MATVISPAAQLPVSITYPSSEHPAPPTYTATSGPDVINGATGAQNGYRNFTTNIHLILPSSGTPRRGILALHGKGNTGYSAFLTGGWGTYPFDLADSGGYAIVAMDTGLISVGNPLALRAVDVAYEYLMNNVTLTESDSRIGILGHSMGGLTAFNWVKENPEKTFGVFLLSPLTRTDTPHQTVGWTPPPASATEPQPGDPNYGIDYTPSGDNARGWDINYLVPNTMTGDWSGPGEYDQTAWDAAVHAYGRDDVERNPGKWGADGMPPITVGWAQMDKNGPYQRGAYWVSQVNSPNVAMRSPYTYPGNDHAPSTLGTMKSDQRSPSGKSDEQIIAQGGLPRYEVRDFFLESEALLNQ